MKTQKCRLDEKCRWIKGPESGFTMNVGFRMYGFPNFGKSDGFFFLPSPLRCECHSVLQDPERIQEMHFGRQTRGEPKEIGHFSGAPKSKLAWGSVDIRRPNSRQISVRPWFSPWWYYARIMIGKMLMKNIKIYKNSHGTHNNRPAVRFVSGISARIWWRYISSSVNRKTKKKNRKTINLSKRLFWRYSRFGSVNNRVGVFYRRVYANFDEHLINR